MRRAAWMTATLALAVAQPAAASDDPRKLPGSVANEVVQGLPAEGGSSDEDPLGANDFLDDLGDTVRVVAFAIVLLLLTPFVVWAVRSRRRRRAGEEDLEADRRTAHEELVAVGEMLRELDIDAEMPGADPAGREALGTGIELYHRADRELAKANTRPKLDRARATLYSARSQATIARRRLSHEANSSGGSGFVSP